MSPPADQSRWDEPTEKYARPLPPTEVWAADARLMCRVAPRLRMDVAPVTFAEYLVFTAATSYSPPTNLVVDDEDGAIWDGVADLPPALLASPVVMVSIEDARAYARWAKKRLPLDAEWTDGVRTIGFDNAAGGRAWEWTASRHRTGNIVRGGRDRRDPDAPGRFHHRSWEDEAAKDVGFRCVVDG